jgi:hypothetical protein
VPAVGGAHVICVPCDTCPFLSDIGVPTFVKNAELAELRRISAYCVSRLIII